MKIGGLILSSFSGHRSLKKMTTRQQEGENLALTEALNWLYCVTQSTASRQPEDRGGTPDLGLYDPRGGHKISLGGHAGFVSSTLSHAPDEEERRSE